MGSCSGAPTILRADRGNENCHLSFLQPFLRHGGIDGMAGEKSFLYGRSTSNQVSRCSYDFILMLLNIMICL